MLSRAARRMPRVRRRGARLRTGRRRPCVGSPGLVGRATRRPRRARRRERWPRSCHARRGRRRPAAQLLRVAPEPARTARGRARAGPAGARGHPVGRPLDVGAARLPGPQPARRAARRAGHVPGRRRALAGGPAACERALAARTVHRIELDPLTSRTSRTCSPPWPARAAATFARELHARAGGNPFFVEELYAAQAPDPHRGRAHADRAARRRDAGDAGRDRRASLLALLERLGVAPDALRAALDAGVLVRVRDGLAFRHGLIGEVVYERLFPAERAALHRAIADALEDAAQRAHHCQRAGLRAEAGSLHGRRDRGRARVRLRRSRHAPRTGARAVETTRVDASNCSASRAGRPLQRRCRARGGVCREALELDGGPGAPRARSTSGSGSSTSGTTRSPWTATSALRSSPASRGCWRPRATH